MKKLISILALFASLLSLYSCKSSADVPEGMKLASSDITDYYLYVPDYWTVDMSSGVTSAYVSDTDSSNISLMPFQFKNKAPGGEASWDSYLEDYRSVFGEISNLETYTTVSHGPFADKDKDVLLHIYTASVSGVEYKFFQLICIYGKNAYIFTYTAKTEIIEGKDSSYYDEHIKEVEYILDCFRFMS